MQAIVSRGLLTGLVSVSNFFVCPLEGLTSPAKLLGTSSSQTSIYFQSQGSNYLNNYESKKLLISKENKPDNFSKKEKNILLNLQIKSESQYWEEGNIFFAEGNVTASINGAILKADQLKVDQSNKTLIAKGNVRFRNGSNYFSASEFGYDLDKKRGKLENVYGVIDIKLITQDLNIIKSNKSNQSKAKQSKSRLSEVKLEDGFTLEGSLDPAMKILSSNEIKSNSINRWRFKASKIFIHKNGWKAKKVSFTNDPFNPPQSRIDAYKVELIEVDESNDNYILTAKKSY